MTPEGIAQLKRDEGLELDAYPDPLSPLGRAVVKAGFRLRGWRKLPDGHRLSGHPWTVGYGHTGPEVGPDTRLSQPQAEQTLLADVAKHEVDLARELPWWRKLDPVRADVLSNMNFNLGIHNLLDFKKALAAAKAGSWGKAADEMLDSEDRKSVV